MNKVIVTTISDDRFGRKDGKYRQTQGKIECIFRNNKNFGVTDVVSWTIDDCYKSNLLNPSIAALLDNKDAARNGRVYKPLLILDTLNRMSDGDFLIYTDCSPEIWKINENYEIDPYVFDINILKELCISNRDILTTFVKWDVRNLGKGELGRHTHKYFTTNRCMKVMNMTQYENYFMHASGLWVIRKTPQTVEFVKKWLYYNSIDQCSALGYADKEDDYSFWTEEDSVKIGHRHDQSVSGLLMNDEGRLLVDLLHNNLSPYNPIQYARKNQTYNFLSTEPNLNEEEIDFKDVFLRVGSKVINDAGTKMEIFEIRMVDGEEMFIVGKSPSSCYMTSREHLRVNP